MLGNRRTDSIAFLADVISMILFLDKLLFDISMVRVCIAKMSGKSILY